MGCCLRIAMRLVRESSQEVTLPTARTGVCALCHRDLRRDKTPPWHTESVICIDCLKREGTKWYGLYYI
ncbi:MAG: hypothetical protein QNJ97_25100 [Myxococcota bacterium]|nr:hypothetical protein [Myxococcota bacterium]